VIQFRDLTLARGAQPLIERANLQIHVGWRVGLVGANGSGKTSLLTMLAGDAQPERGEF
jgi:ATP-binding cassette, subfamily F, member 3